MYSRDFIKERTEHVIDKSKFQVGCGYFIQSNDHGGSWITGILEHVDDYQLRFVIYNSEDLYVISVNDLADPKKGYKITLLVPAFDEAMLETAEHQDPIGYNRYMNN